MSEGFAEVTSFSATVLSFSSPRTLQSLICGLLRLRFPFHTFSGIDLRNMYTSDYSK